MCRSLRCVEPDDADRRYAKLMQRTLAYQGSKGIALLA
jgi:hypothetical protein